MLAACSVEIQSDLTEGGANEVYAVLYEKGFSRLKVREEGDRSRYSVSVSKADASRAAHVLSKRGLPRTREAGGSLITGTQSLLRTEVDERVVFIQAVSGEVANTLKRIPNVVDARVIVNVPQVNDLTQPDKRPITSASVLVKFAAASPTDTFALTDDQLKRFVSGAVPELDPQAVKLMMVPAIETPDPEPTGELLSAGALKATVATLAVLLVAMSAISIALLFRLRMLRPAS